MSNRTAPANQVRDWAAGNGYPEVGGRRGRMPAGVFDAFYGVHTPSGKPRKVTAKV